MWLMTLIYDGDFQGQFKDAMVYQMCTLDAHYWEWLRTLRYRGLGLDDFTHNLMAKSYHSVNLKKYVHYVHFVVFNQD